MSREHAKSEKPASKQRTSKPQNSATMPFSSLTLQHLQGTIGNSALQRLIAQQQVNVRHDGTPHIITRKIKPAIQREDQNDSGTATDPEVLNFQGFELRTHGDVVGMVKHFRKRLVAQQKELTNDNVAAPQELDNAFIATDNIIEHFAQNPGEKLDLLMGMAVAHWWQDGYVSGMNACESLKAEKAAAHVRKVRDKMRKAKEQLKALEPELREAQRAAFRAGDDNMLLNISDTFATILDTTLTLETTIIALADDAAVLQNMANVAKGYSGVYPTVNSNVRMIVGLAKIVNNALAGFQLVRAGIDQITGKKTEMGEATAGISGLSTLASAGGTLLGASASFSLYANLYLGPMTNACLQMLDKLMDLRSRTHNRGMIQLGHFNLVNWTIEPGGRPMFDFMLPVMRGSSPSDVPTPVPDMVSEYFVDNEGDFEAGSKSDLPTTGWWLWEDVDDTKIAKWVYYNRKDIWGMLYGDLPVP